MMEGSGAGAGSGSVLVANGSGCRSGRPKNIGTDHTDQDADPDPQYCPLVIQCVSSRVPREVHVHCTLYNPQAPVQYNQCTVNQPGMMWWNLLHPPYSGLDTTFLIFCL